VTISAFDGTRARPLHVIPAVREELDGVVISTSS
jgi:hypothetical protein